MDVAFVVEAVAATRGHQVQERVHHSGSEVTVWILTPMMAGRRWYIKCFFDQQWLMVISVHPSER